jgi:hypothetical protein
MRKLSLFACVLAFCVAGPLSAQTKPVFVVNPFTASADVALPYDLKQLHGQLVAELKVMLGKQFDVVAEPPSTPAGVVYTLDGEITGWRAGNAAKRLIVGLGSGRESADLQYKVSDASGKPVVDKKDTIRTNFYSQGAGSTGTLGHPFAQKIADRIKDAKLR